MRKLYYIGLIGLALFEIFNMYWIMPMPGSQQLNTLDIAYFLYTYRWSFRIIFILLILGGSFDAFSTRRKWIPVVALIPVLFIIYLFNFKMVADKMFLQPSLITFKGRTDNKLNDSTVVLAVSYGGESKGYPLRYIVYHHQVRDTIGGKPIMVTYCSVCRTGRVFEPFVNGKPETFRLVGMDHFNAMFEDASTKSWWQQATGEAVAGALKGTTLRELESAQLTANKFFSLYPFGKIMQGEEVSRDNYDSLGRFEKGRSLSNLTRTDSLSWKDKSWVVGIVINETAKAYDWKELWEQRVIHDEVQGTPIVLAVSDDSQSFVAFERERNTTSTIHGDTLSNGDARFDFSGKNLSNGVNLKRIQAYQEFWHSWKTFHPETGISHYGSQTSR